MLKSILKASVYAVCLLSCGIAHAVGLGDINVSTALGQALRADIEITDVDKGDVSNLHATLATADAYKSAGIDYPVSLPKLQFQVNQRDDGTIFIHATTQQPINDPFVSLLVQLTWPTGKLLREYTFLLDPPGYKPEQPKPDVVTPIEPVVAQPASEPVPVPAASAPVVAESVAQSAPAAPEPVAASPVAASAVPAAEAVPAAASAPSVAPVEMQPVVAPIAQNAQVKQETTAAPAARTQIVVKRGDTLAKIAEQVKPADITLERMLVTLYRENAAIFDGHNMNRIRAGKILNMPSAEAIKMMPQADAVKEVRVQAADWNAYRSKLAAARGTQPEHEAKQEVTGKITTAVTDKAVAAKEPAKEVLKLSKGEAPNDQVVGNGKATPQEKAIASEEDAIAKKKALKDAQERTALLEKNAQDMKRLAQLKQESPAASAPMSAMPAMALNTASAPQSASAVAAAKPKRKMIMPPQPVPQPSLLDQLLEEPLYLAGAAALLLGLGGAGFLLKRRGRSGGGKEKAIATDHGNDAMGDSTIAHVSMPMEAPTESGDFTQSALQTASLPAADAEEVDPIGEADLFLTFGRDAQAEEVLKEALKKNPNNIPVKLKLLSIYASRKDANSFYSFARDIKESGDEAAWKQTAAMGHEIDPSNPFYGGDAATASVPASKPASAPGVDFDLGFASSTPAPIPAFDPGQSAAVLESTEQDKTIILTPSAMKAATNKATQMDFDVTGPNPATPAVKLGSPSLDDTATMTMDDLVFDVTASHPNVPVMSATPELAPKPVTDKDAGMEFTLDFPLESVPKANPSVTTRDMGLDEITLNLDQTGVPAAAPSAPAVSRNEQWQEVATKLDLAKAYQEMGDAAGAREILEEVLRDGDETQRASAQSLLQQL